MSAAGLSCLAAIPLMPIGDLIVLCFTAPVFAVFLEFLLLGRRIKVTTLTLCCLIGEILGHVEQSIRGTPSSPWRHSCNAALLQPHHHPYGVRLSPPPETAEDLKQGSQYYLGVGLCLFVAAGVAVSNVINVRVKRINESVSTSSS